MLQNRVRALPESFATLLVRNLKALNAKERDHLMRFAYLGANGSYADNVNCWLSSEMEAALKTQLWDTGVPASARCVFAGMDFHLDWLHASLVLAGAGKDISAAGADAALTGDMRCLGDDARSDKENVSLWPVTGSQEDLDLLVVFENDGNVALIFVEAKGISGVGRKQLARKLVRLDRIFNAFSTQVAVSSDVVEGPFCSRKIVLASPSQPGFESCAAHVRQSTQKNGEMGELCAILEDWSGVGSEKLSFVEIQGFPVVLWRVTRVQEVAERGTFSRWKIERRWKRKQS